MKLGITWREMLGKPECPYAERWAFCTRWGSIRVHHFKSSDDPRAFHDHPWWFLTIVLAGSYVDRSPDGDDHLTRGSIRFRQALHRHTVITDGAWTVLVTGPGVRRWGFWPAGKFVNAKRYFHKHGHHPCDTPQAG